MGIELAVWRIHRKIGMSGGLIANAIAPRDRARGDGRGSGPAPRPPRRGVLAPGREQVRPLPGARELLEYLTARGRAVGDRHQRLRSRAPGRRSRGSASPRRRPSSRATRWRTPSPTPTCSSRPPSGSASTIGDSVVVGDSVWDLLAARRAGALGVGLLSGGYGQDELERAGAYRVYQEPGRPAASPRRGRRPI